MKKFFTLVIVVFFLYNLSFSQNQLIIPDTLSGNTINLNLQTGTHSFYSGFSTHTMGVNGSLLGPTLILKKHQNVKINVNNQLGEPTTIHWHGMHVSSENDGGPHSVIEDGQTWSPSFEVLDHAATYWYHPHLHEKTHDHVQKGIAGFIIVRDDEEANLNLPRTYGVDDIPLVMQTKAFDSQKQIITQHTASDSTFMINGTINAQIDLPAQVVRLRLLNGASERSFMVGLTGNRIFHMIASDASLLTAPVAMTRLMLSPGERAEILVDLSDIVGNQIQLINYGSEIPNANYGATRPGMGMQTIQGYDQNVLNGANFPMLTINVTNSTNQPVNTIPTQLTSHNPWTAADADETRQLVFTSMGGINGPFLINGAHFDMNVINFRIPFENIEVWEIRNQTPISHPFHIHNVPFYVLDINGNAPPIHQRGKKDVVLVPGGNGTVRFITKFEDFYNDTLPYMYHCHMLTHEDDGMMGQFVVLPPCDLKIDQQPEHQITSFGNNAQFTVALSDTINVSYQWQTNIGFGFQDLQDAGQYRGTQTAKLSVNNVNTTNDGQLFRCIVEQNGCKITTENAGLEVILSIKNISDLFIIYPNPIKNHINISSNHQFGMEVSVFSLDGKLIWAAQTNESNVLINTENWSSGMYQIKVETTEGVRYHRVVKN